MGRVAEPNGERAAPKLPRVARSRRALQLFMGLAVLAIGVQFTLWARAHLAGEWPAVPRPPGVEGFLPINSLLGLRQLVTTGVVDAIHPAGLAIFLAACLMSWVLPRSFCSHVCPVGLCSELLGRTGQRLMGGSFLPPRWLDIPLRALKWLLLAFFVKAIWFSMSPAAVAGFLQSPYARVADVKMWLFFADPSRTTLVVMGVLLLASLLVRDAWCRYLCPYGALLGIPGLLAPLKITRDPSSCSGCEGCSRVCPARLPVHRVERVTSVECTACLDCVVACPVPSCLEMRPPRWSGLRRALRPAVSVGLAALLYLAVVGGFQLAGRWQTSITEDEYHIRLREIRSPRYGHPGTGDWD